ncbi:MAG TPA: iron ABC transporter permease [Stellaceae bacterium]|nr:iron ABC transporter permease [Stellaceae bacterium]
MPRSLTLLGSEQGASAILFAIVAALSIWPITRLVIEGLAPGGRFDPTLLASVLMTPQNWVAAEHTLITSLLGTAISLLLGLPVALLIALTDLRGKSALVFAFMLPLLIPPQIIAVAWIELVGPASPLLRPLGLAPAAGTPHPLYGPGGISLLLGIEHGPLVFLALGAGLRALPSELLEAAQAAGAHPWRILRDVVLPMAGPQLVAGAALAFVSNVGNFGTPALLGIPGGYGVLTTLIYQKLAGFGPRVLAEVADLSLMLAAIAGLGLLVQGWMNRRGAVRALAAGRPPHPFFLGTARPAVEIAVWLGVAVIVMMPLAALLATSLVPAYGVPLSRATATLENYRYIIFSHDAARRAAVNSLALAGGAALILAVIVLPFGYFIAWRRSTAMRVLGIIAEWPYALPGVVLAIAFILVLIHPLPLLGFSLYNTIWILLIAYLARFLTLSLRTVTAGYLQLDRTLEEAAQMAGAGFLRRLRDVIAPPLAPVLVAGGIVVFLTALNELTLSILLWSSGNETLGIVVFSLEQGGDNLSAAALAVLTVMATLLLMLLAGRLADRLPRGALPWQV